jgi:hypothetical protein
VLGNGLWHGRLLCFHAHILAGLQLAHSSLTCIVCLNTCCIEKIVSNSFSLVECFLVAADMCLPHHCLAVALCTHSTILALEPSCHNIYPKFLYGRIYGLCWKFCSHIYNFDYDKILILSIHDMGAYCIYHTGSKDFTLSYEGITALQFWEFLVIRCIFTCLRVVLQILNLFLFYVDQIPFTQHFMMALIIGK